MGMMGDARGKATESLLIMCLIKTGPEAVIEFDKTPHR